MPTLYSTHHLTYDLLYASSRARKLSARSYFETDIWRECMPLVAFSFAVELSVPYLQGRNIGGGTSMKFPVTIPMWQKIIRVGLKPYSDSRPFDVSCLPPEDSRTTVLSVSGHFSQTCCCWCVTEKYRPDKSTMQVDCWLIDCHSSTVGRGTSVYVVIPRGMISSQSKNERAVIPIGMTGHQAVRPGGQQV